MSRKQSVESRIKNWPIERKEQDFTFSIFSFLWMMGLLVVGTTVSSLIFGAPQPGLVIRGAVAVALAAAVYAAWQSWNAVLVAVPLGLACLFAATSLAVPFDLLSFRLRTGDSVFLAAVFLTLVTGPCWQVVTHWDKAVVLRLGRFRAVKGPGVFWLWPLVDRLADVVDTRIRVTDFSAEKILTRDTVPVHVDGLAFWLIWDAQKAILEVENFLEAVTLSAQTALRDSIGKYTLSTLLAERETLYREIQTILDAKTNPWGISILSVEFIDIQLPKDLEEAMSKTAQAEREKHARLLLGEAELEVSKKYVDAAKVYQGNPEALNLRSMSMVYDAMKTRGSVVVLPSNALQNMNMGAAIAAAHSAKSAADIASGLPGPDGAKED